MSSSLNFVAVRETRCLRLRVRRAPAIPGAVAAMNRLRAAGFCLPLITNQAGVGRGLMTEAAQACLAFAFDTVGAHRVRVAAATENHPSLRVIERLGFRYEGRAREAEWVGGRWVDHAVFAILETDWRSHETP